MGAYGYGMDLLYASSLPNATTRLNRIHQGGGPQMLFDISKSAIPVGGKDMICRLISGYGMKPLPHPKPDT